MEMLLSVIKLPVWAIIATALVGVAVGMFFLTLAVLLLGRSSGASGAKEARVAEKPEQPEKAEKPKRVEGASTSQVVAPVVAAVLPSMPVVSAFRQHYWYYVSGVSGRFATLREALSASGVKVPADKMLDWKKLSPDIRDRIKRVEVDGKQPADEPVAVHKEEVPVVAERGDGGKRNTVKREPEAVIKKPIGHGAFVTIKRKGK